MPERAMSEAAYVDRIIDTARFYGWHVAHFRPAKTGRGWRTPMQGDKGYPDLTLVKGGRVLFAEIKTDHGRVTAEQRAWLAAIGPERARLWRPRHWPDVVAELGGQVRRQDNPDDAEIVEQLIYEETRF